MHGGCRTKPFRNRRCTLAEVGAREAEHDDIAPIGQRATEAVAVFGPHPYNGSSELVGGLCDSLHAEQERHPHVCGYSVLMDVAALRRGVPSVPLNTPSSSELARSNRECAEPNRWPRVRGRGRVG